MTIVVEHLARSSGELQAVEGTDFVLQSPYRKTERESPDAFMPGMKRHSFDGGGKRGDA
jgi:hypothetical protein